MPTYEYKCANGHNFELLQRISEEPIDTCPQCGAAAERVLSAGGGLIFKGSGFYITDYRSDTYKKAAQADTGTTAATPEAGAKAETSTKPESAPAPKSDSSSTPKSD